MVRWVHCQSELPSGRASGLEYCICASCYLNHSKTVLDDTSDDNGSAFERLIKVTEELIYKMLVTTARTFKPIRLSRTQRSTRISAFRQQDHSFLRLLVAISYSPPVYEHMSRVAQNTRERLVVSVKVSRRVDKGRRTPRTNCLYHPHVSQAPHSS
jgi:hypothetical protein